jgi:hypothetical protein
VGDEQQALCLNSSPDVLIAAIVRKAKVMEADEFNGQIVVPGESLQAQP